MRVPSAEKENSVGAMGPGELELHCHEEFRPASPPSSLSSRYSIGSYAPSSVPPPQPLARLPSVTASSTVSFSAERLRLHRMSIVPRRCSVGATYATLPSNLVRRSAVTGDRQQQQHPFQYASLQRRATGRPHPLGGGSRRSLNFHQQLHPQSQSRVLSSIDINSSIPANIIGVGGGGSGPTIGGSGRRQPFAEIPLPRQQQPSRKRRSTSLSTTNQVLDATTLELMAQKLGTTSEHQPRQSVKTRLDKCIHMDSRAAEALFVMESQMVLPKLEEWRAKQVEIGEEDRRGVVELLRELLVDDNADWNTFPLAVSYLDRILSLHWLPIRNLPSLAGAALLLASKMKATQQMEPTQIVNAMFQHGYTRPVVTVDQLLVWEKYTAEKLGWDLSTSTAYEFFDQLMVRAPILECLREQFHHTLQAMMRDLELSTLPPSRQAAVCLLHCAYASGHPYLTEESEEMIRHCYPRHSADSLLGNRASLERLFARIRRAIEYENTHEDGADGNTGPGEAGVATSSSTSGTGSVPPRKRVLLSGSEGEAEAQYSSGEERDEEEIIILDGHDDAVGLEVVQESPQPQAEVDENSQHSSHLPETLDKSFGSGAEAPAAVSQEPSLNANGNDSGFNSEVSTPDELRTSTTQSTPVTTTAGSTNFVLGHRPVYSIAAGTSSQQYLPGPSRPIFHGHQGLGPLFQIHDVDEEMRGQ